MQCLCNAPGQRTMITAPAAVTLGWLERRKPRAGAPLLSRELDTPAGYPSAPAMGDEEELLGGALTGSCSAPRRLSDVCRAGAR
jgi:hypothetical protein